jgi:ribosome-associated toxin RatA of RatAB toxin-antitoxin module
MGTYTGTESAVVAATPEACFAALTDYENLPAWQGALKRVSVVEEREDGALVDYELDAKVKTVRYRLDLTYERPSRIASRYVSGDFRSLEAEWRFTDQGDGTTLAELELKLDPGRFVPGPVRSLVQDAVMSRSLKELRDHLA